MTQSESMTEIMPLGFDFNKQFQELKSSWQHPDHVTARSKVLLLGYRQFYSFIPILYLPIQSSLWLFQAYFYPLNKNDKLFISPSKWFLPDRKQVQTYIFRNSVTMMAKYFKTRQELYVMADNYKLQLVLSSISTCIYFIPFLFMVFSSE